MTNKISDGKVALLQMNYLINLIITILIFFSNTSFGNNNKIIFEINDKIYSELDFRFRIIYLEKINNIKYAPNLEKDLKNDFFNSVIFYEYVANNNRLNNILTKESKIIFEKIKNNFNFSDILKDEYVIKNINYDYSKKIVLEDLLKNYSEYILNEPNDLNFIYNYKINYITIPADNVISKESIDEINKLKNTLELTNFLKERNIEHHLASKNIKDLKKISNKIQKLINSSVNIYTEKNNNFYQIMIIEKELEFNEGIFYNLINFETENLLTKDKENCNYIQSLNNIKSSKEYELSKLNENIKNNLKDINDFLIFQNNNKFNYIFLCQIKVNKDFLKEVNISKKINFIAKDIELDFVNKYSKQYNAKKLYE